MVHHNSSNQIGGQEYTFTYKNKNSISILLCPIVGWIDVTWDAGGSNSYRMGAEGKYDMQLAPSHDSEKLRPLPKVEQGAVGGVKLKQVGVSTEKSKVS